MSLTSLLPYTCPTWLFSTPCRRFLVDCSVAGWCLYDNLYGIVRGDEGHNNLLHDLILERGVKLIGDGHRAARVHVGPPGFFLDWGHNGRFDRIDVRSTSTSATPGHTPTQWQGS
jgi:hypothetical protein